MESAREVSFERAIEFAKANGIHKCFETSAKTGKSVEETFSCSGKDIFAKVMRESANGMTPKSTTTPVVRRNSV